jgi:hypothetical protein
LPRHAIHHHTHPFQTTLFLIASSIWLKTTNNCYVAQKQLYSKPDITYLDPCGPIPHLETATHNNENGTSEVNKRSNNNHQLESRNLISLKVGEEYAYCRSCPAENCELEKTWEFDQEVWAQCLIWGSVNTTQVWTLTTVGFLAKLTSFEFGVLTCGVCRTFVI